MILDSKNKVPSLPKLPKTTKPLSAYANKGNVGKQINKLLLNNLHGVFVSPLNFLSDEAIFM